MPQGMLIRERPSLRLNVLVQTPNGRRQRWGEDDPNPRNAPGLMSFGTAIPGGFERFTCTLQRNPQLAYPDLAELSKVTVLGVGGSVAWQGRLEKLPDTAGYQSQVTPEAVGYQAALEDNNSAREIYVDIELAKWQTPPIARKIELLEKSIDEEDASVGSGSVAPSEGAGAALVTQITGAWARGRASEAWYDALGLPIGSVYYAWKQALSYSDVNWNWNVDLVSTETGEGTTVDTGDLRAVGPGSGTLDATALSQTLAFVQLYYDVAAGGEGVQYPVLWTALAVYGTHGLTLYGPDTQTEAKGVLASDVVAHALGKWAAKIAATVGPEGSIQPTSFVIPHLAFLEATNVAEIIKQATRFELEDWAVWEGPMLYMNARGARGNRWKARVGPAQLQQAGPQISRLWNGVVVAYTDVTGRTRLVGPPGFAGGEPATEDLGLVDLDPTNPLNEAGETKWALLKMGTSTAEGAKAIGRAYLREQATLETSGQASIVGHVEDERGTYYPAWMIRGGDQISFVDASNTGYRKIVSTNYDDPSKTNTLQLEQPPDDLQALLERLSVVLLPLGLG